MSNAAPALQNNASFTSILEDGSYTPGESIDSIFNGLFSDPHPQASLSGIVIVGNTVPSTEGVYQYSTDGGETFFDIGTVGDDATALVLSASTIIRFVPADGYTGTPSSLTIRALDDTYSGGFTDNDSRLTVDAFVNGGKTAISATTNTLTANLISFPESQPNAQFNLSDLDGNNGFLINGNKWDNQLGRSVSAAGDLNNDGIDDFIVGEPYGDSSASIFNNDLTGNSYVVFGGAGIANNGSINVASLNGVNGFVIKGANINDFSGISVSAAGDFNDDGIDDIIIGADGANSRAGKSYVVFGGTGVGNSGTLNLAQLGNSGLVLNGISAYDYSGISVSAAGDINDDGVDDIIIGAPGPNNAPGQSYVVFGGTQINSIGSLNLGNLGSNGFILNGAAGDRAGRSVSDVGDFNGDGIDDIIIGAPYANNETGKSYVVFGNTGIGNNSLNLGVDLNGSNGFTLSGSGGRSGFPVSSAGDFNGDGFDDIIIGATLADPNGVSDAGISYLVFGGTGIGAGGSIDLTNLSSNGFVLSGISNGDSSGRVSAAGDLNGDGFDDIIIGASGADTLAGESYVVFGGTKVGSSGSLELADLNGHNGFVLNGIDIGDQSGFSVSDAGDINNDGIDDIIIGAPQADLNNSPGFSASGEGYIVYGNIAPDLDLNGNDVGINYTINFSGTAIPIVESDFSLQDFGLDSNSNRTHLDPNTATLTSATIQITNLLDGSAETLNTNTSGTNIINSYDATTGTLTLSGTDTLSNYQQVLQTVTYTNTASIPNQKDRIIAFVVDDGAAHSNTSAVATTTLNFISKFIGTSGNDTLNGTPGNDHLNGLAGNDYLNGHAGNDSLHGSTGNDSLYGSAGDDFLDGNNDDDYLNGGQGNDTIIGGLGNDSLHGIQGNDHLNAGAGDDVIAAGEGNDYVDGAEGQDRIYGEDGHDTLFGSAGEDTLYGQDGHDHLNGGSGNDTLFGQAGDDRLFGWHDHDELNGGEGNDLIVGGNGDDFARGDWGNDTLLGDAGNDTLVGHGDDDSLKGGSGNDSLIGGQGNDTLLGQADDDYLSGSDGDDELDGGDGNDVIGGGNGDDFARGDWGNDTLVGGAGNDTLVGHGDDDSLKGGSGNDSLIGGQGNDTLLGETGDDYLSGREGDDDLHGGEGDDLISGGDNNDTLDGFWGNDTLYGDSGDDLLYGGKQNDSLIGGDGNDTLYGQDGADHLLGREGDDHSFGGTGNDVLNDDWGHDLLNGGDGDDVLDGGQEDDTLVGGLGADTLTGGTGANTFQFDLADSVLTGFDSITDLKISTDQIDAPTPVIAVNILGAVAALTEADIQSTLTTYDFVANGAATFNLSNRTFLAINDGIAGYTATNDALIEITGYSGELISLEIV